MHMLTSAGQASTLALNQWSLGAVPGDAVHADLIANQPFDVWQPR